MPQQSPTEMAGRRVAVVVASLGRPSELHALVERLHRQTLAPSHIVLSVTGDADLPAAVPQGCIVVRGAKGSTAQRNRGMLEVVDACDVVAFLDDDYVPSSHCVEGVAGAFARWPDVVGANGVLLADGVKSAGIAHDEACELVDRFDAARGEAPPVEPRVLHELNGLYGCNMTFRASAIGEARFDENLPLYGWQEDIDFAAQLLSRGRLVKTDAFAGVHRGVKGARTSGVRLGYSQIANPVYLARKGTMSWPYALKLIGKNLIANHARAAWSEPWTDRRGRVRGNWRGLADLARGRIDPRRILEY